MSIDITSTPIHLGRGGTARPIADFSWSPARLAAYERDTLADGADGRMVMMFDSGGTWDSWERHPAGDEVIIVCTGNHRFLQELEGGAQHVVVAGPGEAFVNPAGAWHTADGGEGGIIVSITSGLGTEHRPR